MVRHAVRLTMHPIPDAFEASGRVGRQVRKRGRIYFSFDRAASRGQLRKINLSPFFKYRFYLTLLCLLLVAAAILAKALSHSSTICLPSKLGRSQRWRASRIASRARPEPILPRVWTE